ncbi:PREDICTED: trace amine-associated receptor 9-like [Acropora digitifera]|uniref:trace amine-associated receptor 9-like n=1 Tax=Acropora digitifera TaxID=70779 RepID=UPI00077ADBD6|nr:PREDICTED: trace amine-associated receptor 9-like [Acropora digitifera]
MANHSHQQNITSSFPFFSSPECIAWLTVFGIETAAIVALNVLTIIVYLKERRLRKRSMYLVINQAVADMCVGASVISQCWFLGSDCNFWTINYFSVSSSSVFFFGWVFLSASLMNLAAISLERTHATFRPFKHRLVKKKIFGAVIAVVWITAGLFASTRVFYVPTLTFQGFINFVFSCYSFYLFCLLIIVVSYLSIAIKIVCGTQCHHHGATRRERKLTKLLFLVTVVSLLLTLPFIISKICFIVAYLRLSKMISPTTVLQVKLHYPLIFLFYTSSFVNPIFYAFRIPEFRRALFCVFHCRPQPQSAQGRGFPLNEI